MTIPWNDHYLDKEILKNEIHQMVGSFAEVLLEEIPGSEIKAIYHKGSAQKEWESPLDYVPEISDIDIHILFFDDSSIAIYLGSLAQAMNIQSKVEERYFSKTSSPLHLPRPQLVILNRLINDDSYVPSPRSTVTVLHGESQPEPDYRNPEKIRVIDRERLINEEEFISVSPLRIVDRPSKYLWDYMRTLVWHVSPTGPRVLHILGLSTEQAWSMNRTKIVSSLREVGEHQLAKDYSGFYLSGWEYFLSRYSDSDSVRSMVISGLKVLSRGSEIARNYKV